MTSTLTHRMAMLVVVAALVLTSGTLVLAQTLQPIQPIQPLATEAPDDRPGVIPTLDPDSDLPTRPSVPTPTPHPARQTPVPTTDNPPGVATTAPVATEPVAPISTAIAPNPQPNQPTIPPINQPTPTPVPPFIPGQHNRVEVALHECPDGYVADGDEAAYLAACIPVPQTEEMFAAFGVLANDVGGVFTWEDLDYTPGQVIVEEPQFPGPGLDIAYPDQPVVFCGEGDNPRVAVPLHDAFTIRPETSSVTNVDYRCSWFTAQLESNAVDVHTFFCGVKPDATQAKTEPWFRNSCIPEGATGLILTDVNGSRPMPTVGNRHYALDNVDFGSQAEIQIAMVDQSGHSEWDSIVFCESPLQWIIPPQSMTFKVYEKSQPVVRYACNLYQVTGGGSFNSSLQIPNLMTAETWYCPAGFDPASEYTLFRDGCVEPAPGIDVAAVYPGGMFGMLPTSNGAPAVASFGLIGLGEIAVTPDVPEGHSAVAFCWYSGNHGDARRKDGVVAYFRYYYWDWRHDCEWYFIPES